MNRYEEKNVIRWKGKKEWGKDGQMINTQNKSPIPIFISFKLNKRSLIVSLNLTG